MGWRSHEDSFEHLDCRFHEIPFFIDTKLVERITTETFHNSALVRQGIIPREKALEIEEALLKRMEPPKELLEFLMENGMTYTDFENSYNNADPQKFVPSFEKILRKIYRALYYKRR